MAAPFDFAFSGGIVLTSSNTSIAPLVSGAPVGELTWNWDRCDDVFVQAFNKLWTIDDFVNFASVNNFAVIGDIKNAARAINGVPPGLRIDATSGAIVGVAEFTSLFACTVTATDAAGNTLSKPVLIHVQIQDGIEFGG